MPKCKEAMDVKLSGSTEPPGGLDSVSVMTVCLTSGLMDDLIFPELSSPNEAKIPLEGVSACGQFPGHSPDLAHEKSIPCPMSNVPVVTAVNE